MLKVDYDQLEAEAKKLEQKKQELEQVVKDMGKIIYGLGSIWEAETEQEYEEEFRTLEKGAFKNASDLVDEMYTQMRAISKSFREADESMKSKMGVK
jgi:WXG100 family type VII secretion target